MRSSSNSLLIMNPFAWFKVPSLKAIGIYSIIYRIMDNGLYRTETHMDRWTDGRERDMKGMEGPLGQVFGGPVACVLDQARIVGNMEQTIPMLVESTGLTFKTVQKAVKKLVKYGLVKRSRKVGNAQTYRFDVEHDLHELLAWADELNLKQIRR